jgi:hypothetical protein
VLVALVSKLLIILLQYLAGLLLLVEEVLQISFRSLQLIYTGLNLCNQQRQSGLDYLKLPSTSTRQGGRVPLFLLRGDLFFRTRFSLFAYISWTSL